MLIQKGNCIFRVEEFTIGAKGGFRSFPVTKHRPKASGSVGCLHGGLPNTLMKGQARFTRSATARRRYLQPDKRSTTVISASYNIEARYWIRAIVGSKKPDRNDQVATQEKSSSAVAAKHQQTLASLISLVRSVSHGHDTARRRIQVRVFPPLRKLPL